MTVHCQVRDPDNSEKLKHLTDAAASTKGSLKFFKADLLEAGSYLKTMKGCSVVFQTASPFVVAGINKRNVQEELLDPGVKGTAYLLDSVANTATVKRVVLTTSCLALVTDAAACLDAPN